MERKYKIALYNLTTTTKYGGIETFNWEMAKALAKRGHIVHIYGGKGNIRMETPFGVSIFTYPFLSREKIPDFGSRFRKLAERLSFGLFTVRPLVKGGYDIIYVHKPYDLPVALLSSRISGAKVLFGSGGTEFFPGYRYMVKRIDSFLACSKFNASQIEHYSGISPLVLPNGVDTELFRPLDPDTELKHKLELTDAETVIISACRLIGLKGIQHAIRSISKLVKDGYLIKYLIIGNGVYKKDLEMLANELSLKGNVIFLGSIENSQLPRYYSLADIALFPSIADEAFGISIAEAMACGVPVISTNIGGIPEVITDGETGILVRPSDPEGIAEKITFLLSDVNLRKEMGKKARQRVVDLFSWDIIVGRLERIFRDLKKL